MTPLEQAFTSHRQLLWTVGYRMLGTATDADEIVQDTFVQAMRSRPDPDRPLKPWLIRVAINKARDRLRRRRRAAYAGPWLPAPIPDDPPDPERHETVSYALMVALEQLTPTQRAVWLLREIMDLDTVQTADILAVRPGSVKVTLHRARRALATHPPVDPAPPQTSLAAVAALADGILAGDVARVVSLLADDIVALSDGGGVFHAARVPVVGASSVARLLVGLARRHPRAQMAPCWAGGLPGVHLTLPDAPAGIAPRCVVLLAVRQDRIAAVYLVVAPDKLTAMAP